MNGLGDISFSTATILNWYPLLKNSSFKNILIESLQVLTKQELLTIYAYVIMPNHLHIIWGENDHKRKETAQASFFKYTSHQFLHKLRKEDQNQLRKFYVEKSDRKYQFWQRNTLNIEIITAEMFDEKLHYIHNNPVQDKWQLAGNPVEYKYSSGLFYETGKDDFGILTDYYLA